MGSLLKQMNAGRELPRYQSHKIVWALKIRLVIPELKGQATIYPQDSGYEQFLVSAEYVRKHQPQSGGYYVVYEDGYESWSPNVAFENGYQLISSSDEEKANEAPGPKPRMIDSKYVAELRDGRIVIAKIEDGQELPEDEPLGLFRAQDILAPVSEYLTKCIENECPLSHINGVKENLVDVFQRFAEEHPDRMKLPGT